MYRCLFILLCAFLSLLPPFASAQEQSDVVEVEKIKEKYWAKADETELGVVQNRAYANAKKLEFGIFGGTVNTDPFLLVRNAGATAGYYFSPYFSTHIVCWKNFASGSSALKTFEATSGYTANTNIPRSFCGAQASGDFLYGKLSLFGAMIIYFDLHVRGGVGETRTESGKSLGPFVGLGQQIHLNKGFSLTLDYRMMVYQEALLGKVPGANFGTVLGNRTNVTDVITLGVSFTMGAFSGTE
ncbi:hypothetical protein WDW86_02480 [Bdellovibrionota bacterium FG-2]